MLWRFYMQGKVLPVYKILRKVEIELPSMSVAEADAEIARLSKLETHVTQRVRVSAAYMPEVFHLRSHIRSVIVDLLRHKEVLKGQEVAAGTGTLDGMHTQAAEEGGDGGE
jgi:hypothetical protein